jgi:hypothetical protein
VKRSNTNLAEESRLPHTPSGSFTCHKSATQDPLLYFPSEGRHAVDFYAQKNPTASAGFEPAILGTRGHRPPKPLPNMLTSIFYADLMFLEIFTNTQQSSFLEILAIYLQILSSNSYKDSPHEQSLFFSHKYQTQAHSNWSSWQLQSANFQLFNEYLF